MGKYQFNFDYIARKLDEIIEVKGEKKIAFKEIFLINDLEAILESAYDFKSETSEAQKSFIIEEAIKVFGFKPNKNGRQLKSQIRKIENNFLLRPLQKFSILTSLSFPYFDQLRNLRYSSGSVNFYKFCYPRKYKFGALSDELNQYSKSRTTPPHGYVPTIVNITARTTIEAIEKGLEFLDLIRGIWNYSINFPTTARIHFGHRNPINEIRTGPTFTLFLTDGKLVAPQIWYEVNYVEKSSTWGFQHKWEKICQDSIWIRKALNKMPYRDHFFKIFIRYSKALDTNDYETAYLKLWSLLELLTDTKNAKYDDTISRALFFYNDDNLGREIMEHLRIFRNKLVHTGEARNEMDSMLFQIKRFVERMIWYHLKFSGRFKTIEEFGNFLDLSKNKGILEKEIELRKEALNFLNK